MTFNKNGYTAEDIKSLREEYGYSMMDARKILVKKIMKQEINDLKTVEEKIEWILGYIEEKEGLK